MRWLIRWAAIAAVALLGACGGGEGGSTGTGTGASSGSDGPPAAPANRAPVADAGSARSVPVGTAVSLDGRASSDADGDTLSYTWAVSSKPAGSAAALTGATSAQPGLVPDVAGAYTLTLSVSDGRGGGDTSDVTVTATAVTPPAIAIDQVEPLSGTARLSLTGTVTGAVTWYVDLRLLGSGNPADSHAISWNTSGVANGAHQVLAVIQGASGSTPLSRTVQVGNSTVTLSATVSGTTGTINVDARASSSFGITSVSARFKGVDIGFLTQPNACSRFCSGPNDVYRFTVNAATAGSGTHTMEITATDAALASRRLSVDVPVSNAPALSLSEPADGAQVFGSLRVSGTASSDKAGVVTTTARLGDLEFLNTLAPAFTGSFSLSGLPAGSYTLTVRSTDSTDQASQVQRTVVVTSSPALAYTPVFSLPAGGQLLAADGSRVLYSSGDGGVAMRDLAGGSEVRLEGVSTLQYATDWQLSGGRVYAQAKDSDCTPTFNCVYEWSPSGARRNLSLLSPYTAGSSYQENPVARDGHVVWTNWNGPNPGSYTLFEVATGTFTRVSQPAGVNYVGNTDYDLAVSAGVVQFVFWGQTGGEGMGSQFDTYLWRSDTGVSSRITSGGARHIYPLTDGARMAWQQSPVGGSSDNTFTLQVRSLAGGATASVSSRATSLRLRDGVLAWVETPATGTRVLKAATATATSTLSSLNSATLLATGGGHVVFGEAGKTYSWNQATGARTLRVEAAPSSVFVAGGAMVFTVNGSVYRVALD